MVEGLQVSAIALSEMASRICKNKLKLFREEKSYRNLFILNISTII